MNIKVPFWRVAIYILISYGIGIYLGHIFTDTLKKEIDCVTVDKKIYCGRLVGGDN